MEAVVYFIDYGTIVTISDAMKIKEIPVCAAKYRYIESLLLPTTGRRGAVGETSPALHGVRPPSVEAIGRPKRVRTPSSSCPSQESSMIAGVHVPMTHHGTLTVEAFRVPMSVATEMQQ